MIRSFRLAAMALAASAVIVLCAAALAQPGLGPGGPGFGGPGGTPPSSTMLLGFAEVQKEIALSDTQKKQVAGLLQDLQEQIRSAFGSLNFQELQGLGQEEREKRFAEVRTKADEAAKQGERKLGKILDAKQLERLSQLQLQLEGPGALGRPEIAAQLGLSAEQQARIREQEPSERVQAEIVAILTDQQQAKWSAMQGKEFQFPLPPGPGRGFSSAGGDVVALESVKTRLRASDEEWKVIGPKLRKLIAARQAAEAGINTGSSGEGRSPRGGFGGPPNRGRGGGPDRPGGPAFGPDSFAGPADFGPRGFGPPGGFGPGGPGPGGFGPPPAGFGPDGPGPGGVRPPEDPGRGNADPAARGTPSKPGSDRPPGGGPPPGFGGRDSVLTLALADLQAALADAQTTPEQLQDKVNALRTARRKARDKLQAAQQELLELLTPDQEAVLLGLGYID